MLSFYKIKESVFHARKFENENELVACRLHILRRVNKGLVSGARVNAAEAYS